MGDTTAHRAHRLPDPVRYLGMVRQVVGVPVSVGVTTMLPSRCLAAALLRILANHVDPAPEPRPALMAYPDREAELYHVTVFTPFGRVRANLPMS